MATEVLSSRMLHGKNQTARGKNSFVTIVLDLVKEPMIILLLAAATLYFTSGATGDGFFMLFAIVFVTGISLYQESRSRNAIDALRSLTQPMNKVIRDGKISSIPKEEIVVGDFIIVEEGASVPADALIIHSNDFAVNESILTGESFPVNKNKLPDNNLVFQGTTALSGLAICEVKAVGSKTELGKIGKSLDEIQKGETPLQKQIGTFVKIMALAGTIIFFVVWAINFLKSHDLFSSLLLSLTLAMSILPEEIPVAFTTFMALGAWRLLKSGVIVKHISTVETLGSAGVICIDKTGTITENRMTIAKVFELSANKVVDYDHVGDLEKQVITLAMWASEPIPFDPMEVALHAGYGALVSPDIRPFFKMVHEYPLGGNPPMMTHVFEGPEGKRLIAAKGAPEAMINVAELSDIERNNALNAIKMLTASGYRVLGVGSSDFEGHIFPEKQQSLPFVLKGFVAFYDPPKKNIDSVLNSFYDAGILVKIITGDNAATTRTIAKQIHFRGYDSTMSGDEIVAMSDDEITKKVVDTNIFTRMFPDAKLRIINALKANGNIVAMTGDGVNDGPALKAAHISIAMGKKGSEIAKEVSSLVLTNDNLRSMVDAISTGRKIYTNLKKAIQYIISIHIPIILTVFIPLAMGWIYPMIFTPVHVIFLELIMGPTCSIVYENEPIEKNAMTQPPRPLSKTFLSWRELRTSIAQGLAITIGILFVYQYAIHQNAGEDLTRTIVFMTLLSANIFLTFVNRSFYYALTTTLKYKNNLVLLMVGITVLLALILLYVVPVTRFFKFETPSVTYLLISITTGCISVIWLEGIKFLKRFQRK